MRQKNILSRKGTLSQYVKRADIKSSDPPIYIDAPTTIESILQFNKIKVDGKSGDGDGNGSAPPPPPPASCLLDIVIGCDFSGSMGDAWYGGPGTPGWGHTVLGPWKEINDFVREFVTGLDALMDGSIHGVTGSSDVQVGTYLWTGYNQNFPSYVVRNMTDASSLIEDDTNIPNPPHSPGTGGFFNGQWVAGDSPGTMLGHAVIPGAPDVYDVAVDMGKTMLDNFAGSALGNRSSQPNYRRIMIILTDADDMTGWGILCNQLTTNMANAVWDVGTNAGSPELDIEVFAYQVHLSATPTPSGYPGNIDCLVPAILHSTNIGHGTGAAVSVLGQSLANTLCAWAMPVSYNCSPTSWTCSDPGNGSGFYSALNGYPNPQQACDTACAPPPPPPPGTCLLDIAIGCDLSGSLASGSNWAAENDFVREFVTGLDTLMDGSIGGITGSNDVQVGTYTWTTGGTPQDNVVVRDMTRHSSDIESDTNIVVLVPPVIGNPVPAVMGVPVDIGGDSYMTAVTMGKGVLDNFGVAGVGGSLGDRSSQLNYRRIMIIVTDAATVGNCGNLSSFYMQNSIWNWGTLQVPTNPAMDIEVYALVVHSAALPPTNWQAIVGCLTQNPTQFPAGNIDHGAGTALGAFGTTLASIICTGTTPTSWECSGPNGFVSTNPLVGTVPQWMCYDPLNGSGSYGAGNPGIVACAAVCNPPPPTYSCSGPFGVSLAANTPPDPVFGMNIPPWECFTTGMGTGQFTGINALANCETVCVEPSWDCDPVNFNCYDPGTGNGQWNSANGGLLACETACYPPTWKCHIPWQSTVGTCTLGFYSPPEYALEQDCIDACLIHVVDPHLTGEGSWNCDWTWVGSTGGGGLVGNCNSVTGTSGTYAIKQDCLDACKIVGIDDDDIGYTWRCHIPWKQAVGTCTSGLYNPPGYGSEQDCIDACKVFEAIGPVETGLTAEPCEPLGQNWGTVSNPHNPPLWSFPYIDTCTDWRGCETYSCPCGWTAIHEPTTQWEWKCEKTLNGITKTRKPYVIFTHYINGAKPHTGDVYLLEQWLFTTGGVPGGSGNQAFTTGYQNNTTETFGATTITWDSAVVICPGIKDPYFNYPWHSHHSMSEQQLLLVMSQQTNLFFYADTLSSICI